MKIENVRGIIWDLDGTLLDSFEIFEQIIADVAAEKGLVAPDHDFMLENYHGQLSETIERVLGLKTPDELEEVFDAFLQRQNVHYAGDLETHLFLDAAQLAQRAAKLEIHQTIVTNRAHENRGNASPRYIVAATTLADFIHDIYPTDEVEFKKPDIRSAGNWIEKIGLQASEVLVVGDQHVDAQLAINLGARAVLVGRNGQIPHLDTLGEESSGNVFVVDSLDDVELV